MATSVFRNQGAAIDYTPTSAVAAGDVVVQGELVGVARLDIAANALGALAVDGVFQFPKTAGSGEAIAAGALVYWDATAKVALEDAASGANKLIGKTVLATLDADTSVLARLSQ